jgi:hypothetical protein
MTMGFVIKATVRDGSTCWLTPVKADGIPTPGPREKAELFQTRKDAQDAIANMSRAFDHAGILFSVESAD